jgi:hypothetical protein
MDNSYAVGWFALALINTNLAQLKRYPGIVWFAISLLLGPLATLVLAFMNPRTQSPSPAA